MGKINFPRGPQAVPALDLNLREKARDAKEQHPAFVAKNRKDRKEANPDADSYKGGFPEGHPNANIVANHQTSQSDLAISLDNAKKARRKT